MSGKLVGMVFDHYPFPGGEKLLAVKLADNAHENGCHIYPSVATLSRQTHQSERTIQYQLKRMIGRGWLLLVKHAHGGRGHAREYRINPTFIEAYDPRTLPEQRPTWEFKAIDGESVKGAEIAPFTEPQRVQSETLKGATAIARKGATAVAPQPSLTVIEPNTPLPPTGGETSNKTEIDSLLAKLIEAHGRHATSDTKAAHTALREIAPDPASSGRMLADLRAEVETAKWQRENGRFRPRLSRWLRGWRVMRSAGIKSQSPTVPEQETAVEQTRQLIASMGQGAPPSPQVRERLQQLKAAAKAAASDRLAKKAG